MNVTYCRRSFTPAELERIREPSASAAYRNALARAVCTEFGWFKPDGGLKVMSCKVALLKMERDGLITLPPPLRRYRQLGNRRSAAAEPQLPVRGTCGELGDAELLQPRGRADSHFWNELMAATTTLATNCSPALKSGTSSTLHRMDTCAATRPAPPGRQQRPLPHSALGFRPPPRFPRPGSRRPPDTAGLERPLRLPTPMA